MSTSTDSLAIPTQDPAVLKTQQLLFEMWFPADQIKNLPPDALNDIKLIAQGVSQAFWDNINNNSNNPFLDILYGMTYPKKLPFYDNLVKSTDPVIKRFITVSGGFGSLSQSDASHVLGFFFEGSAGPLSSKTAMIIREVYLSTIWGSPLDALCNILPPETFTQNPGLYSAINYPNIPQSNLKYDDATHTIYGDIDYLIIGSGPAGATVAYELQQAGKRVVLIEQGPFVVWGSMNTMSYSRLMFGNDAVTTSDNGVLIRSGQAMGGGSTVNIDLAFSPLEATIQARIAAWIEEGLIDGRFYTQERMWETYEWVRKTINTRAVSETELNRDNKVLWDGAKAYGVDPSLYHLNRFGPFESPSPVTQKRDAARQLILPAMQDPDNPLSVIPDVSVQQLLFASDGTEKGVKVTGASLLVNAPWKDYNNTIIDPCQLNMTPGTTVTINAPNVILCAGTIGSTRVLLNSASKESAVANPRVGKGLIIHPSFPLIGIFDTSVNLLEGLDSGTHLDSFGVTPGFIFETMSGLPAYGALLIPGSGLDVYNKIIEFNNSAGFGVMLVDTPSDNNSVELDSSGAVVLNYTLSESDKQRFRIGVGIAIRMMFLAGAKEVIIPTNENVLGLEKFDPMVGVYLTQIEQADLVEKNIQFIPNRTVLTAAHLQATNKIGSSPDTSVVSTNQRVWNWNTKKEIPNLYLMDSSMFPTSVGANPMQSLYTFAKIFSERIIGGMDS